MWQIKLISVMVFSRQITIYRPFDSILRYKQIFDDLSRETTFIT